MTPTLSARSEALLKTLIEAHLAEGEPVGSRLLSKRFPEPLSSATIRNVLADLEEEGLLAQPHTSAGRVPTEQAYRYYVDHWVRPTPPGPAMGARLSTTFQALDQDPELWIRHTSKILSEVMGGICVALPVRLKTSRLARLEFVPLGSFRLVAVWVGTEGEVEHQVMDNPWGFSEIVLTELGNFATRHFAGCSLLNMHQRLLSVLQDQIDEARQIHHRLTQITARMTAPTENEAAVVVAGLGELGGAPEFEDARRFRDLVQAFEEHEQLTRLLGAFAEAAATEVKLLLGSENPYLPSMPLATAMRTVHLPWADQVTFALVGPLRVDYTKLLGGLAWWSEEISRRQPRSV